MGKKWTEQEKRQLRERRERLQAEYERSHQKGMIHAGIAVKFDIAEFGGWPAENVKAFMAGIAEVVNANN